MLARADCQIKPQRMFASINSESNAAAEVGCSDGALRLGASGRLDSWKGGGASSPCLNVEKGGGAIPAQFQLAVYSTKEVEYQGGVGGA